MFTARVHTHPRNQTEEIYGQELSPEDLIESTDKYADPSGTWKDCKSFPGFKAKEIMKGFGTIQGCGVVVRPLAQPKD